MSLDNTLGERSSRYGDFRDHARIAQALQAAMHDSPNWSSLPAMHKEALQLIQHKIARILNGDPNYADNWHDIQGYAKLVEDRLSTSSVGSGATVDDEDMRVLRGAAPVPAEDSNRHAIQSEDESPLVGPCLRCHEIECVCLRPREHHG